MKKSVRAVLALFSIVLISYFQSNIAAEKHAENPYYAQNKLAISLLNQLQKQHPKESIFYSPHSVYQTLLMAYFGAGGETKRELEDILNLKWAEGRSDIENIFKLQTERSHRFQNQSIEFSSVNKFYVSTCMRIRDLTKKLLNTNIETLNFADDVDQCIEHINKFVAETTKNHIKDFITANEINKQTNFAMVNAIYFKGQWASPFDKNQTKRKIFYNQDGEAVYVDMMYKRDMFEIGDIRNLGTDILKIPYKGDGLTAMYIFLPVNTPTAIDELLDNLTPEILDDIFNDNRMYSRKVSVDLPKFSLDKQFDLVPGLQHMGVQSLFKNANLSGIFETTENFETNIIHKAKIDVNEEGSTAVASTMLYGKYSRGEIFNCDHPFMFVIHDQKLNEVLFAGIYRGPGKITSISNSACSSNINPQKGYAFSCFLLLFFVYVQI